MTALAVLFGTGLVFAASFCLGSLLQGRLKVPLTTLERPLFAFVTGSACLSAIMFVLCTMHWVYRSSLLALAGVAMGAYWLWHPREPIEDKRFLGLPAIWRYTFLTVFSVFAGIYFVHAWAPEVSPDGTAYHLAIVNHYLRAHGFEKVPTNIYFNISQAGELLFLMACAFGKHSAAAMVHCGYLALLPWLMLAYGRRFGMPVAGAAAALFTFLSPVIGADGLSAYVDVALAAVTFAMFYLLQIWDEHRDSGLLILAAILAGFAFSLKYTAFVAALFALGFVVSRTHRIGRAEIAMGLTIGLFAVPWLVKSWMWVDNPLSPFGNGLFPNRWVHIAFEESYRAFLRDYGMPDRRVLPWEATVRGNYVAGLLGPVFLLAPLGLLSLRRKQGRTLLFAGTVLAIPYISNIGTRFLVPAVPFFALAMAEVLAQWPWALYALVTAHAVLSFPTVVGLYAGASAWRIDPELPIRAALRLETEESYLRRKGPGYLVDKLIEEHVPPGESVFLLSATAEAYTSRSMLVRYLSAPNETLGDMLWTPLVKNFQPRVLASFKFPSQTITKIRAIKTGLNGDENWSIAEFRIYSNDREIPRAASWRLLARPNPWDVQLAFDNNPVTRWNSWQRPRIGDYVQIDFGQPQTVNGAALLCSSEYTNLLVGLEIMDREGHWKPAGGERNVSQEAPSPNLRSNATYELKSRKINYLVVYQDDLGAADFRSSPGQWGLTKVGESNGSTLYRIR